jgi:hypothetical protein
MENEQLSIINSPFSIIHYPLTPLLEAKIQMPGQTQLMTYNRVRLVVTNLYCSAYLSLMIGDRQGC